MECRLFERHQDTIWTNADLLSIEPLGTNFSEILTEILFHGKKCSSKRRLQNDGHLLK